MPLPEYSQGQLGEDRAIHFGISNVGQRRVVAKKTRRLEATWLTLAGPPRAACVCKCVQGNGLGRGQAVDSVEGFLEPEEGMTEAEAGGAEAGGLG